MTVDQIHNRVAWGIFIVIFGAMLLGCSALTIRHIGRCKDWADIEKERKYASFDCLYQNDNEINCNRARWHYGWHHAHSVENECTKWRKQ